MARQAWKPGALRWDIAEAHPGAAELARQAGISPLTAGILMNRGLADVEAVKNFLQPKMTDLIDPLELPGTEVAAKRIVQAVADGEKIVIYGDYDVDGMTSTAILHACIKMIGGQAEFYVPHRLDEGYGVNAEAVKTIIADGAKLIITVDCGISAGNVLAEVAQDVDVIITDHHTPPDTLPDVMAIVHPALPGHPHGEKNPNLCGAGVAFKLAWQVAREASGADRVTEELKTFLLNATCLAALGTIADIVPLIGENRIIATFGLRGLRTTSHIGMRALLDSANVNAAVDSYHVGFVLAPRLNASGRMGHAAQAVEMLTGEDPARATEIAKYLAEQNTQRQQVEREISEQAREMVLAGQLDADENFALVLANENWHGGVIGIVASRMVDQFGRPAVIIAIDDDGLGQGSARSIPGFHMAEALKACDEYLISHGGHAMAGGLRIHKENIDAFIQTFSQYAKDNIRPSQLTPTLHIDAATTIGALDYNAVRQLESLGPFGSQNPQPIVAIQNCRVLTPPRRIGKTGTSVSMVLQQNGRSLRAFAFGMGDLADRMAGVTECDIAGQPNLNTFNGQTNVEIKLTDVRWE